MSTKAKENDMTLDEAKEKADILSKINLEIWNTPDSAKREVLRTQFKTIWRTITMQGFKIIRGKKLDSSLGYHVPSFKIREDHSEECVCINDNRAPDGYHKGDCTTRAISFCTGVDYMTIQREQFARAKAYNAYGVTWRTPKIWSQSLTTRGYCELELPRHVTGKVFLRKLKDYGIDDGIIAAKSAHHIAAIDMKTKKILDTWNSAGCRIKTIFVPVSQKYAWTKALGTVFC